MFNTGPLAFLTMLMTTKKKSTRSVFIAPSYSSHSGAYKSADSEEQTLIYVSINFVTQFCSWQSLPWIHIFLFKWILKTLYQVTKSNPHSEVNNNSSTSGHAKTVNGCHKPHPSIVFSLQMSRIPPNKTKDLYLAQNIIRHDYEKFVWRGKERRAACW